VKRKRIFYFQDLDRSGAMELGEFFLLISLLIANKVERNHMNLSEAKICRV